MEANQIVQEVFINMGKMYESIFKTYYPSHGSNGFTERNLTFYFSHFYLKNANNLSDIIIWQEVPILGGEHFDTLIIDSINKIIFIIEAKRLQNEMKGRSIDEDFKRILSRFKEIANIDNFPNYSKYALLLADIWIPESNKNKIDLRNFFIYFNSELNIEKSIENRITKINNINKFDHSLEEYWLMYNLYEIEINSKKCP